jgi:hypothetical protein
MTRLRPRAPHDTLLSMRTTRTLALWLALGALAAPAPAAERTLPPGTRPRLAWGAAPAAPGALAQAPRRITVHHTDTRASGPAETHVAAHLRSIQRYHQTEKKWPDVAYHLFVDAQGRMWEGRNLATRGDSGTVYDLSDRALVCLIGKFDADAVPAAQWNALVVAVGSLCRRHAIPTSEITMHRQLAQTSCPGAHLAARIADGSLKRAVDAWLERPGRR